MRGESDGEDAEGFFEAPAAEEYPQADHLPEQASLVCFIIPKTPSAKITTQSTIDLQSLIQELISYCIIQDFLHCWERIHPNNILLT